MHLRLMGACTVQVQGDGGVLCQGLKGEAGFGCGQGSQGHHRLAVDAQAAARGEQPMHPRCLFGQAHQAGRSRFVELFAVVQHQQQALAGHGIAKLRGDVAARVEAQRPGQGVEKGLSALHTQQRHEHRALKHRRRLGVGQGLRHLDGQPCLAHASRPHEADPGPRQHPLAQLRGGGLGTDQAREVMRQARRRQRALRRRRRVRVIGRVIARRTRHRRRHGHAARNHPRRGRQVFEQGLQPAPLVGDPLVVVPGHELAGVEQQRLRVLPCCRGLLEGHDVTPQGSGHQAQRAAVGTQHRGRTRGLEHGPQQRQRLPQAAAPALGIGFGPEQRHQFLARVITLGLHRQACQQGHGGAAVQAAQLLPPVVQCKATQQLQAPRSMRAAAGGRHGGTAGCALVGSRPVCRAHRQRPTWRPCRRRTRRYLCRSARRVAKLRDKRARCRCCGIGGVGLTRVRGIPGLRSYS
jgi:hypothetical protein